MTTTVGLPKVQLAESEHRTGFAGGPALEAVYRAILNPGDFPDRDHAGDVMVGAMAAGADHETAQELAIEVHMTKALRDKIPQAGGLLVGATTYLERLS